jgi:putative phosphoesterase
VILHAGDFTSAAVLDELRALGPLEAVHGNMDEPALKSALPARLVVEVEGTKIGLVHDGGPATGRPGRLAAAFPDCAVIVFGHSHLPEISRVGETWVVNPGSPTERRRAPYHTMGVVRGGRPEILRLA